MAFLLLFSCIVLAACSEQAKPDAAPINKVLEKEADVVTDEITVASLQPEGMIAQKPGKFGGVAYGTYRRSCPNERFLDVQQFL